ncbi:MAG: MFS transporter [Clostridia bacterium]|nr:MFS transporter [Clostridia bacterium]
MNNKMLKASILSLSVFLSSAMSVSAALADIAKAFPDVSSSNIQMIISLPSLLIIPFSLIAGVLSNKLGKKMLVMVGLILLSLGGVAPAFTNSFASIMISRSIFGIGVGLITPFATGLIADFFDGPERAGMMGLQAATNSLGSSVLTFAAGLLCVLNWHNAFFVYALGAIVAILVLFKLPEPAKIQTSPTEKSAPNKPVFLIAVGMFLYMLFLFSFYSNIAFLIEKNSLGNPATSGMVITAMTLGGLLVSLFFGKLLPLLKRYLIAAAMCVTAIGFMLLSMAQSIALVYVGAVFIGFGTGFVLPYCMLNITFKAPKAAVPLSIAIGLSFINIGSFASPFLFKLIGTLSGNTTVKFSFLVTAVFFAVALVIAILAALAPKKQQMVQQ